jgi:small subunit ribosomal protein S1
LALGDVVDGVVWQIVDFGVFVSVGGLIGLLHRSQMIKEPTKGLDDRFTKGQRIKVTVSDWNLSTCRLSLSEFDGDFSRNIEDDTAPK